MVSLILIATGLMMLTGSWMLWRAVRSAPEGFEDETGFHPGAAPRPALETRVAASRPGRRETAALAGALRTADPLRPSHHASHL